MPKLSVGQLVGSGWVGVVVGPWHYDNGASSKIDDVLSEDGGLLQALPLAVHLNFFGQTVRLDHSYFLNFFVGPLLHA